MGRKAHPGRLDREYGHAELMDVTGILDGGIHGGNWTGCQASPPEL